MKDERMAVHPVRWKELSIEIGHGLLTTVNSSLFRVHLTLVYLPQHFHRIRHYDLYQNEIRQAKYFIRLPYIS